MKFEHIQLEQDETVLTTVRRHWFYLVAQAVPLLCIAFLPLTLIGVSLYLPSAVTTVLSHFYIHLIFLYCVWLLCILMLLASIWTDYYLDIWCVTNRRIVKIDQVALFRRKTGSFRLERMQDVNVEINGILATLLGYGTVHVQTASADLEEFKASFLPNPQDIKSIILEAGDKLLEQHTNNTANV